MNPRATVYSVQKITTLQKVNDATAKNLLTKIAEQVRPIMEKRKWTVGSLEEFFPPNPNLLVFLSFQFGFILFFFFF